MDAVTPVLSRISGAPQAPRFGTQRTTATEPAPLTWTSTGVKKDPVLGDIETYQFSNGMKLAAVVKPNVPTVSYGVVVNTGAGDEKMSQSGVSHFLEHLMFKGTPNQPPGSVDTLLEGLGANSNAWTSHDETVYYFTGLPKENLSQAVGIASEMLQNALIPRKEMNKERFVVVEEINQYANDKKDTLTEVFETSLHWQNRPYSRLVLGPARVIKTISRRDVLTYYAQRYAPENRTVVVVGDINVPEVLTMVANNYNKPFPPQGHGRPKVDTTQPHRRTRFTPGTKEPAREAFTPDNVSTGTLVMGVPGPRNSQGAAAQKAILALQVATQIIADGKTSRLYRRLVEGEKIASNVDMSAWDYKDATTVFFNADFKPDAYDRVKAAYQETIQALATTPVSAAELRSAKLRLQKSVADTLETQSGVFRLLAKVASQGTPYETSLGNRLAAIDAITAEDVRAAIETYVLKQPHQTSALMPREWVAAQPKPAKKPTFGGGKLIPAPTQITLPSGALLNVIPNPRSPKITWTAMAREAGHWTDVKPGLMRAVDELYEEGTQTLPGVDFHNLTEGNGVSFMTSVDKDTFSMTVDAMAGATTEALAVMHAALRGPLHTDEGIASAASKFDMDYRSLVEGDPARYARGEVDLAHYPREHAYHSGPRTLFDAFKGFTSGDIAAQLKRVFTRPNLTLAVAGPVTPELAEGQAKQLLLGLPSGGEHLALPHAPLLTQPKVVTIARQDVTQAQVFKVWDAPASGDKERASMMLLDAILSGGMTSRFFKTFRENEKGLCYQVYATYQPAEFGGSMKFGIGTDPKNITRVLTLFNQEVRRLVDHAPTDEEIAIAKKALKTSITEASERQTFITQHTARHTAFKRANWDELLATIDALTPEQLHATAIKYFSGPDTTFVVAPEKALKKAKLPVTQVFELPKA